ncbi:MAG: GGDEF domain-containing protein [Syntrophomonadaceae bacterium]|nr:GGDEF domain-containing protein [Syntrophomonadaceae bacterium]
MARIDIFTKEDEILEESEKLLESGAFSTSQDEEHYRALLHKFKRLLKQMKSMVKISDIMQGELIVLSQKLEIMSTIDSLTGLHNRRFFNEAFRKEWLSSVRSQEYLAILMIDIDHFKKYNDTYGHLQGDQCLQQVAAALQETVKRPRDIVARFGGEEFVVLLTDTNNYGAKHIAEQILLNVRALRIAHIASCTGIVTVSIGVATAIPDKFLSPDALLTKADEALYRAKNSGRNSICF